MKKIIHIDADCFYASVEMCESPELKHIPIAVGGFAEKRGVIATCNYPARTFGVKSAMPTALATKLCPKLKVIKPRMDVYRAYSNELRLILKRYSETIEFVSLDEAYLDVSNSTHFNGSATRIASAICHIVKQELGITVSAGVAPVKFLAKIASDWKKPEGLFVITPDQMDRFVNDLEVNELPGVGPVTSRKLAKMNIYRCSDIRKYKIRQLKVHFGEFAYRLFEFSHAIDKRSVSSQQKRKSMSVERTFEADLFEQNDLLIAFRKLHLQLMERISSSIKENCVTKVFVKLKFCDFSVTTVETNYISGNLETKLWQLFKKAHDRKILPIRLLGLGVKISEKTMTQLCLDL